MSDNRTEPPAPDPGDGAVRGSGAEAAPTARQGRTGRPADWRRLVPSDRGIRGVPLALGVELRHRAGRESERWSPRPVRTATPREIARGEGELLLGIRPLMRSEASGSWIQGDASWDVVRRSPSRFGREQSRWFAEMLGLARDALLLSGSSGEWLVLDHIESSLLWGHLRAGALAGIPLHATQKGTTIVVAEEGTVAARIDRAEEGGLTVGAEIVLDGRAHEPSLVRPIGRTGVYAVTPLGARTQVTLAEAPLSAPMHALLTASAPVVVPEDEEGAFLREAYPLIARRSPVRASDAVRLPPVPGPEPTLSLVHGRGDRVEFAFGWAYPGYGLFPLAESADAVRDDVLEREGRGRIEAAWQEASGGAPFAESGVLHDVEAAEFARRVVPALEERGIGVIVTGTPRTYRELTGEPEITVTTVPTNDPDWFDLGVLVTIDGRQIPFTPLFTALSRGRKKLLLVDGSHLSLNHPALDRLRELIEEAGERDEWETGPRISRYQIALWEDFEDLAHESLPAVAWRATAEGLRAATGVPAVETPAGLRAALRPYQKAGLDWLAFLWRHRLGGILADDMGLGKTLQILALLLHVRETGASSRAEGERRPFLVVAPTSVLSTWRDEAARFAPGLRVRVLDSTSAKRAVPVTEAAAEADLIVTSYTLLRLDEEELTAVEWAGVVLDEAQFVKNPATRLHRAVTALSADVVYAVTGTPVENGLADLWALLALTAPGLFPSARRFRTEYIQPIEKGRVPENEEGSDFRRRRLERLRRRVRPLMLRRTKELVARELPEKQEQILAVEPSPAHRALYEVVLQRERQKVLGLLEDLDRNRFIVFRSLTLLRMLSLAPGLVDEGDAGIGSRKLDVLIERVEELRAEGHRALVFSQFTSFLALAAERLERAGIPYALLDGSTRQRDRVVQGFRTGAQPVFLISLKAGGFGMTLTEADYVFLLDPWWNPAAETQAIDRTHRIGQRHPVFVYRMISTGTIEEKVLALQQRKARLFRAVMDDEDLFARSLTAEDIRGLFEG